MQIYAVGDIHGYVSELDKALDWISADRARSGARDAPVIFVGDLGDRGPDTKGVYARLVAGLDAGKPWIVLKGNHDRMFEGFLGDPRYTDPRLRASLSWLDPSLGGASTLRSYGVANAGARPVSEVHAEATAAVPDSHKSFQRGLQLYYETPDLIFVHAGIRPGVPLERQVEDDLVWIRDPFLYSAEDHGRLVVHGHTVVDDVTHFGNRIAIDTGAGHGYPLIPVVFENREPYALRERGRARVRRER